MNLKRKDEGDVTVLALNGRLMGGPDANSFQNAVKGLIEEKRTKVLVNLAGVSWINSTGLGILISAFTSVKNAGGQLKLVGVTERIQSILMITKLSTVFETFEDEATAIGSYGS